MYTFDTNAIIYYLQNDPKVVLFLQGIFSKDFPIYISAITEIELFGFPGLSQVEMDNIESIVRTLAVIPVDSRIARIAGALRRMHHLKTPDSAVAATAMFTGSTLLTRNIKDFERIPNLRLQRV